MDVPRRLTLALAVALAAASCGQAAIDGQADASPPASSAAATPLPSAQASMSNGGPHEAGRVAELAFHDGDFYDVPDPLPPGERGTLMRLQPLQDNEVAR